MVKVPQVLCSLATLPNSNEAWMLNAFTTLWLTTLLCLLSALHCGLVFVGCADTDCSQKQEHKRTEHLVF